jgi:Pterin 4 alpha carbinolamine dehydratase
MIATDDLGDGLVAAALAEKTCTPCRGGVPPLTLEEAEGYRSQAPEWALMDGASRIERTYRFKNFRQAFAFVARVAEVSEMQGHHLGLCDGLAADRWYRGGVALADRITARRDACG